MKKNKKLQLSFLTDQNKTHTIIIDNPVYPVIETDLKDCIQYIIDQEVFAPNKGKLVDIKGIKVVERTEETVALE